MIINVVLFVYNRKYQQRINLDLLSGIANCLLHDTIFEIVKGLKEIQDVTEKHLFQTRLQLLETHRGLFFILYCSSPRLC